MTVRVERTGAVVVLTIDRPHAANALDAAVIDGLATALVDAEHDPGVRALVLTGAGERAFCAGMDLAERKRGPVVYRDFATYSRFKREGSTKPVVAAVNGAAVAGGFELVLACDLVVAAEHATFGLPEIGHGLFAAGGGMALGARIPLPVALEIGLTGSPVDARRAHAVGLVNRVVPATQLRECAVGLAEAIAAHDARAVAVTKRLMTMAARRPGELWAANDAARDEFFQEKR